MNFTEARAAQRPADHIVVLSPSAFCDTYQGRPASDVAVGLRRLSEREAMTCMAEARKEAAAGERRGEAAEERFSEALLCWTIGYAACDPNDVSKPYFARGDEEVRDALTPSGLRRLWDELEMLLAAESPLLAPVSDDDLAIAAIALTPEALALLPSGKRLRVRRWLRFILDEVQRAARPNDDD